MIQNQEVHNQNSQNGKPEGQKTLITQSQEVMNNDQKQNHADTKSQVSEQQIPDHFYDSDIASVCEKDFMSDNEPPKDIVQERKLLYKEKLLHVFKTIIRVGSGIDKPARYDLIRLKHKQVSQEELKKYENLRKQEHKDKSEKHQNEEKQQNNNQKENKSQQKDELQQKAQQKVQPLPQQQQQNLPPYYSTQHVDSEKQIEYNIGNEYEEIERLVTSMKRGETALFELQHLVVSKKSNIKIKSKTQVHVIHAFDWTTVIDLDGDKKLLKYVLKKGEGAFRVALYDKITFNYQITRNEIKVQQKDFEVKRLQKEFIEQELPNSVWRVLTSMKDQQSVRLQILDEDFQEIQGQQYYAHLQKVYNDKKQENNKNNTTESQVESNKPEVESIKPQVDSINPKSWILTITISNLIKVDDIHLDGRLLKQTLVRGVSTAKPQSSSLIYYAIKFIDLNQNQLKKDQCFDSDWWEDYSKLDQLPGIRKNYLDDYTVSKMLRKSIKRMKPAEIALIQCRDKTLFTYGNDYQQMKQLLNFNDQTVPQVVKIILRVYNFTQAKNAFNMEIQQKIIESKRKKQIALKLLSQGRIEKALKKFENIVAFYSSEKINQQAYDQKVSALMNAILCLMKLQKYPEMIKLCNQILLRPRHGHQSKDIKIVGPGHAKVQGSLKKSQLQQGQQVPSMNGDTRRIASDLVQNQKILDKCLYRKAFALYQMGECGEALKSLDEISENMKSTDEVKKLYKDATAGKQKYESKSKKIFKSMFG